MFTLVKKAIDHPEKIIMNLSRREFMNWMSDKQYVGLVYRLIFKRKLNLDSPQTFNEKIQWLKLYDRKSLYTKLVDKFEVKKYGSSQKLGDGQPGTPVNSRD